jgi:antitoxin CcdA
VKPKPLAHRKTTNKTGEAGPLAQAKALKNNTSQASERELARAVAACRAEFWLQENRAALDSSNEFVEQHGLPLSQFQIY